MRFIRLGHGHVNIFEDAARSDAEDAVRGLDEIVAFASAVLAAEMVDEGKSGGDLFRLNQKAGPVGFPLFQFHLKLPRYGHRAESFQRIPVRLFSLNGVNIFCESESECTSEMSDGQFSIFGASEENGGVGIPKLERMKEWMK